MNSPQDASFGMVANGNVYAAFREFLVKVQRWNGKPGGNKSIAALFLNKSIQACYN